MRRANLKTKIMNKAQKFLLENNLDDIVLNSKQYKENTTENAEKWIYLSDVLEQYLALNQALRIHDVVGQSEQLKAFVDWWHGLSQEELVWYEGRYVEVFESL